MSRSFKRICKSCNQLRPSGSRKRDEKCGKCNPQRVNKLGIMTRVKPGRGV